MTAPRAIPQPDMDIVIEVRTSIGNRRVSKRIVTVRDLGSGRYTCLVQDTAMGGYETVTIAPRQGGQWIAVEPPVDIQAAIHVSRRIEAGEALHGGVQEVLRLLARAVTQLTGNARPTGPAAPARVEGA